MTSWVFRQAAHHHLPSSRRKPGSSDLALRLVDIGPAQH